MKTSYSFPNVQNIHLNSHGSFTPELFVVPKDVNLYIPASIGTEMFYKDIDCKDVHPLMVEIVRNEKCNSMNLENEEKIMKKYSPYKPGSLCHDIKISYERGLSKPCIHLNWKVGKQHYNHNFVSNSEIMLSDVIEMITHRPLNLIVMTCVSLQEEGNWLECYPDTVSLSKQYSISGKDTKIYKVEGGRTYEKCCEDTDVLEKLYDIDRKLQNINFWFVREFLVNHFHSNEIDMKEINENCDNIEFLLKDDLLYKVWYNDFYRYMLLSNINTSKVVRLKTQNSSGVKCEKIPYLAGYVGCLLIHLSETCFDFTKGTKVEYVNKMLKTIFDNIRDEQYWQ